MRTSDIALVAVACVALLTVGGCVVAAVGVGAAGTVAYVKGDLELVEPTGLDQVYSAAERAVDDLGLFVLSKKKDELAASIIARDADDKKIYIRLSATSQGITKLSIRVGTFGNETKARLVYDKIKENL